MEMIIGRRSRCFSKEDGKRVRIPCKNLLIVLVLVLFSVPWQGCVGESRKTVERIDDLVGDVAAGLEVIWSVKDALKRFDFEDSSFMARVNAAVHHSRLTLEELDGLLCELEGMDYTGHLKRLGESVHELIARCREGRMEAAQALGELARMMEAIEPVMREEAVITQLEAPRSDQEWLGRLIRLRDALEPSLEKLKSASAAVVYLKGLKTSLFEILTLLHDMVNRLMTVLGSGKGWQGVSIADRFDRMQALISDWESLVEKEFSGFSLFQLDPWLERVDLELNELLLRK